MALRKMPKLQTRDIIKHISLLFQRTKTRFNEKHLLATKQILAVVKQSIQIQIARTFYMWKSEFKLLRFTETFTFHSCNVFFRHVAAKFRSITAVFFTTCFLSLMWLDFINDMMDNYAIISVKWFSEVMFCFSPWTAFSCTYKQ